MIDFDNYIKTLPRPLSREEEDKLLIEYFETKDENLRNKLIEHKLRLCVKVAYRTYNKLSDLFSLEELYSECCKGLMKAIDSYNPTLSYKYSFVNYAVYRMEKGIKRVFKNEKLHKTYFAKPDYGEDGEETDAFNILSYDGIDKICDELESEEFVQDILNHINQYPEIWRKAMQMSLGLNSAKKFSCREISEIIGFSKQQTVEKIAEYKIELKKYILKKYPALELRNETHNIDEIHENIFNDYYGLNGSEIHTGPQIADKYGYKSSAGNSTILRLITKKLIKLGKYSPEQIEQIKQSRKDRLEKALWDFYAYCYFSYYGFNGYEKKPAVTLAHEFNYSVGSIEVVIYSFKKHLESLPENQRNEEVERYSKHSTSLTQ